MALAILPLLITLLVSTPVSSNSTAITSGPSVNYSVTPVTTHMYNTTESPAVEKCQEIFIISKPLHIPYIVCYCIAIVLGFLLIFFGYRCFKLSMFLTGFMYTTFVTYVICSSHTSLATWGLAGVSVAVGLFIGLLTMFVSHCGLFLCGFTFGFEVGVMSFVIIEFFYHIDIMWIPFGVLLGLSLIFALMALKWQKTFAILATAMMGGILVAGGADYFIEEFVLMIYMWRRISARNGQELCLFSWIVLGMWPLMFIMGSLTQFLRTGRNFYHKKRKNEMNLEAGDRAMKRYRSLNRNGDVVAKSYYQDDDQPDLGKPTNV